jgi:small multidrug resistance family-3 protein
MFIIKTFLLFVLTAIAEIVGCYLPYLVLKQHKPAWLLLPAILSLIVFVWLLTLHPAATGRVYAAYGGIYVAVALGWLFFVESIKPTSWDFVGVVVVLVGALIVILQPEF